jgi:hypothetical protein
MEEEPDASMMVAQKVLNQVGTIVKNMEEEPDASMMVAQQLLNHKFCHYIWMYLIQVMSSALPPHTPDQSFFLKILLHVHYQTGIWYMQHLNLRWLHSICSMKTTIYLLYQQPGPRCQPASLFSGQVHSKDSRRRSSMLLHTLPY